jgi:hypothetical protein
LDIIAYCYRHRIRDNLKIESGDRMNNDFLNFFFGHGAPQSLVPAEGTRVEINAQKTGFDHSAVASMRRLSPNCGSLVVPIEVLQRIPSQSGCHQPLQDL